MSNNKISFILQNPPYDHGLYVKFLHKACELADHVISVQPATWFIGKKKDSRMTKILNESSNKLSIDMIDGARFFQGGILGQLAICSIDFTNDGDIEITNNNDTFHFNSIQEINTFCLDRKMTAFNDCIKTLYETDNLNNHLVKTYKLSYEERLKLANANKHILRISGIRGHVDQDTGIKSNDFYTLLSNNEKEIVSKVLLPSRSLIENDKISKDPNKLLVNLCFIFNDSISRDNLYNFIRTDFCRACFVLSKINVHFDGGELKYVPWFDFSDPHFSNPPHEIDDWLFDKYNISNDVRKHIEEILSDYYHIRQ